MTFELEHAWKLVETGTDENCDLAAKIAITVANNTAANVGDRAEAMFILGQIARFLQPWRCPDDGVTWFRNAIQMQPSHLPSMLALCELAVRSRPMNVAVLDELMPQIEALRSTMTPGHEKHWEDVCRLAGRS